MAPSRASARVALLAACALLACDPPADNPSSPDGADDDVYMRITLDSAVIGAGVRQALLVTASVTRDAAGESVSFTTSSGSFRSASVRVDTIATVDVAGRARVFWYPPDMPGTASLTAIARTVRADTSVTVTAVPAPQIAGLPGTVATNAEFAVTITVDARWAGRAIDVVASGGAQLTALGPVDQNAEAGTRVRPIADGNGVALISIRMPATAGTVRLTSTLLGTTTTASATVQ